MEKIFVFTLYRHVKPVKSLRKAFSKGGGRGPETGFKVRIGGRERKKGDWVEEKGGLG